MEMYVVVKVFGVDAVKPRIYTRKEDAMRDITENIQMLADDNTKLEVLENGDEKYYIINKSNDPTEYNEIILKRCEVR